MNRDELKSYFKETLDEMYSTMEAKNSDYCKWQDDAFLNFKYVEKMWITTTENWLLTRITDKVSRIISLLDNWDRKVKDETIQDTCVDAANYFLLLSAYLKSKQDGNEHT